MLDPTYVPDRRVATDEVARFPETRSSSTTQARFFDFAKLAHECDAELAFKCDDALHIEDPQSVRDIGKRSDRKHWEAAMSDEIKSLNENNTWTLTKLPPGRKPIKAKWIFKTKRDSDGNVVRYKTRLVAKGYSQRPGRALTSMKRTHPSYAIRPYVSSPHWPFNMI